MKALQHLQIYREAVAYVNANDDRVALDILWELNHLAKALWPGDVRGAIYACKNAAIRNLYERGYCVSLTRQIQTQICWRCDGTGVEPYEDTEGDWCFKCGGSGIWKRHTLYRFVFEVCDKRYVWHQPEKLVTWPVVFTDEAVTEYTPTAVNPDNLYLNSMIAIHMAVVHAYLRKHGVPADALLGVTTLRGYVQLVLRRVTRKLRNRWYDFKYRNLPADADIPF